MVHILATVNIEELEKFISVFATRGAKMRAKHGNTGTRVFTVQDNPNEVRVLFIWESKAAFERFQNDPEVKATMQASGTLGRPKVVFLDLLAELPS